MTPDNDSSVVSARDARRIEFCANCGWPLQRGTNPPRHTYGLRACKTRPYVADQPEYRDGVFATREVPS